ncbi:unnamed protein product, partial [Laminaria digitata]
APGGCGGDVVSLRSHGLHRIGSRGADPGVPRDVLAILDKPRGQGDRGNGERPHALRLEAQQGRPDVLLAEFNAVLRNLRALHLSILGEGDVDLRPADPLQCSFEVGPPLVLGAVPNHPLKWRQERDRKEGEWKEGCHWTKQNKEKTSKQRKENK